MCVFVLKIQLNIERSKIGRLNNMTIDALLKLRAMLFGLQALLVLRAHLNLHLNLRAFGH
jgi:hypothetical protein